MGTFQGWRKPGTGNPPEFYGKDPRLDDLAISCDHIGAWPHCHQSGTNQELMEADAETYHQILGGVWESSTLFLKNKIKVKIKNCQEKNS